MPRVFLFFLLKTAMSAECLEDFFLIFVSFSNESKTDDGF